MNNTTYTQLCCNMEQLKLTQMLLHLDEITDLYGFPARAIVSMSEVVEELYNKEVNGKILIDDKLKAAIDAYYKEYGAE